MRYLLLAIAFALPLAARAQEAPPAAAPAPGPSPAAAAAPAEAKPPEAAPPAEVKAATADTSDFYAWEVDLFVGYGELLWPATDTDNVTWSNGGPGVNVTIAYRSEHFTHPFLDIGYVPILASGRNVNVFVPGQGANTVYAKNSTSALGFVFGPGFDIDWFRARAGVGVYSVSVNTTVDNVSNSASTLTIGFLLSASAFFLRSETLALGVEGRVTSLQSPTSGIYQSQWEIGLTGRWDFVHHR